MKRSVDTFIVVKNYEYYNKNFWVKENNLI